MSRSSFGWVLSPAGDCYCYYLLFGRIQLKNNNNFLPIINNENNNNNNNSSSNNNKVKNKTINYKSLEIVNK